MPDKTGSFLKAGREIYSVGANIVRVSYNKAVDIHTLFIDVSGNEEQLRIISQKLEILGYVSDNEAVADIMLIEFRLKDVPGAVLPILELIETFDFNISYISSQENGTDYQNFRMGLRVTDSEKIKQFLEKSSEICDIKIIDYDKSKKVLDNSAFYLSFAEQITTNLNLDKDSAKKLIADSNLIMQMLDEKDEPAYKVFDNIAKFADLIERYKGDGFCANVTRKELSEGFSLYIIEPSCGSNTAILEKDSKLLFVDCGFACYKNEMEILLSSIFPDYLQREKQLALTHSDIDHCGFAKSFNKIYLSRKSYENFKLEEKNLPNFREQNKKHAPYCRISKLLTGYTCQSTQNMLIVDQDGINEENAPIVLIGNFDFGGLYFDVYAGNGGHAKGEIVIVCEQLKIVFSGDIVVNIAGFSKEQREFNAIAPYLMTSVNMNTQKASEERAYLLDLFSKDKYLYCCGHGPLIESTMT